MNTRHVIADEVRAQIVRLVRMGWTYTLVAAEIDVSQSSVSRVCAQAGLNPTYEARGRARPIENRVMRLAMAEGFAHEVTRRRSHLRDGSGKYNMGVLDEEFPEADGEEIRAIVDGTIKSLLP